MESLLRNFGRLYEKAQREELEGNKSLAGEYYDTIYSLLYIAYKEAHEDLTALVSSEREPGILLKFKEEMNRLEKNTHILANSQFKGETPTNQK